MKQTRNNMLAKLRNRLLAINLISLTLVIAVAFTVIYLNFSSRAENEIEKSLSSIPRGVMENVMLSRTEARPVITTSGGVISGAVGITISGDQRIPVDYSKSFVANVSADGAATVFSLLDISNEDYILAIETAIAKGSPAGEINIAGRAWRFSLEEQHAAFAPSLYDKSIVFLDVEDTKSSLLALRASLFVIGIIAVGIILLISLTLANRAIRPVEESIARQRRFIADASHELKTPIAVIAANTEALFDTTTPPENTSSAAAGSGVPPWLSNIQAETDRMSGLVESLLDLARAEETPAQAAPFDLTAAVREETHRVEAFLFEKQITLTLKDMPAAPDSEKSGEASVHSHLASRDAAVININSDRKKIQAILSILLENAVKYTPEGGSVTVTVSKEKITVANTGPHIPAEELKQIFDRFFRADPSRSSETGGHGIGLSIAIELARSLGAHLSAISIPRSDGVAVNTFTLTL